MKAILRAGAGLFGLLLLTSTIHGYNWVTPVTKQPYPIAPSPATGGYYLMDANGHWCGPHYYLVPPFPPHNGFLPGPVGQAIMAGNLPPELLKSKEAMTLGNMPMLGKKQAPQTPQPAPGQGMAAPGPMPGQGPGGFMPYAMPNGGYRPSPHMQTPYAALPWTPYALQPPYVQPMPYPPVAAAPVAYAPGSPIAQPMMRPIGYVPYYGPPGMVATAQRDPRTGLWLVQYAPPSPGGAPFMPIPGFGPGASSAPPGAGPMMMPPPPMPPGAPPLNLMPMQPFNGVQPFNPMMPLNPLQGPQPPQMDWQGMQLPRMDMMPPPMPRPGGAAFPTHPFTRSPRDFFMWGEMMEDERARGSRPFPVP